MTLTVENALLDGERVGVRCEDGSIAAIGPEVVAQPGRRDDRRRRRPPGAAAGQRPHPRGDDALPRLRRRPAADAVAGREDLAGRGEALRRGRLLGRPPRLRRDAAQRHHPLLGHVLAPGGDRAGGRRRRHPGDDRRPALRPRRQPGASCARWRIAASRRWPDSARRSPPPSPRTRSTPSARSRCAGSASSAPSRDLPVQIHLSETEGEVQDCLAAHGARPAFYLDRLGLLSERTVLAHGVWLDPEELALVAERGATVVSNPVANMKLAVGGVFPYPAARAAGVRGRARHRRRRLQRLARPARRPEDLRPRPEARRRRPDRDRRRRGLGRRHRRRRPPPRRHQARAGRPGRLPPPRPALARAGDRRAHRRPRLRRQPAPSSTPPSSPAGC